ncbi:MAG: head GIN domain-containing protein [Gilvibacter sp.]
MRRILLFIALSFSFSVFSQNEVNKSVGEFDTIKVFDLIEVEMIQSTEDRVVVSGRNVDEIKIVNDNGKLKIRMELDGRFDGSDTFVKVYFTGVKTIDANEGARITLAETLAQDDLELKAQEGGKIKLTLAATTLETKAVTGGIIEVEGTVHLNDISVNTGGVFNGKELESHTTKINVSAGGDAEIFATQKADIKITAGGDVYVYGNPPEFKKKTVVGGRVYRIN